MLLTYVNHGCSIHLEDHPVVQLEAWFTVQQIMGSDE